jgi:hypothetical protein
MICRELMNDPNLENLRVGEESAGEFARKQLEAARNDPRVRRDDGRAMMADFWDAMEEAERVRTLTQWGLHELTFALGREEERQGFGTTLTRFRRRLPDHFRRLGRGRSGPERNSRTRVRIRMPRRSSA